MSDGLSDLGAAVGLVFVFEGLMLALAPAMPKRLAAALATVAESRLRLVGLAAAAVGVGIVWVVRS